MLRCKSTPVLLLDDAHTFAEAIHSADLYHAVRPGKLPRQAFEGYSELHGERYRKHREIQSNSLE